MIPASFARDGFVGTPASRYKGLLIGTEGGANTGKTEFILSGPPPGIMLALDRQYRGCLESAAPPETRQADFLIQPVDMGMTQGVTQPDAEKLWRTYYDQFYLKALRNPDARTVGVDGDSDSFECQTLAAFGRTSQIPQIQRTGLNAARRLYIARATESLKVVIMTNKLKKKYETVLDADGNPVIETSGTFAGQDKRVWDGKSYERQGWNDHEYGYDIQLRHLYNRAKHQWGIQIQLCKANRALEGDELWGLDCNLPTLLQYIYPHIELREWGYV